MNSRHEVAVRLKKWAVVILIGLVALTFLVALPLKAALAQDVSREKPAPVAASSESVWYKPFLALSIAILVAVGSIAAGYAVAHVGSAALGAITERPELTGRSLIFLGLAEGIAIYGLLMAILLYGKLG